MGTSVFPCYSACHVEISFKVVFWSVSGCVGSGTHPTNAQRYIMQQMEIGEVQTRLRIDHKGEGRARSSCGGLRYIVQQMTIVGWAQRLFSPEPIVVVPGCYAVSQFYG